MVTAHCILYLDISILTAVMDIPELPDVIDSLIKTYQSRFLWDAHIQIIYNEHNLEIMMKFHAKVLEYIQKGNRN